MVYVQKQLPYLLKGNAHLLWPNYVTKIRVHIRFDAALDSHKYGIYMLLDNNSFSMLEEDNTSQSMEFEHNFMLSWLWTEAYNGGARIGQCVPKKDLPYI